MSAQPNAVAETTMTTHEQTMGSLARRASEVGSGVVEVAGVMDDIDTASRQQLALLHTLNTTTQEVIGCNSAVQSAASDVERTCSQGQEMFEEFHGTMHDVLDRSQGVAKWVSEIDTSLTAVMFTLREVESMNSVIAGISRQVNILAVNAKIEAARAGDAGRGFAVVAEAINELSQKTAASAAGITQAIDALTGSVDKVQSEANAVREDADQILTDAERTDRAVKDIAGSVADSSAAASRILAEATRAGHSLTEFAPTFRHLSSTASETASGIESLREHMHGMIDTTESLVQDCVEAGGAADDQAFILDVQERALDVGHIYAEAIATGRIAEDALFSTDYRPVAGSNPAQVMTEFTTFTDSVLPDVQEPALDLDPRVIFCAAVDRNGYLPTHNLKFSKPQGADPAWNAANSRNRRIFDDRVGLKAGRNRRPFLLQVYRRDMGGGRFVMMKDVSAPIMVNGRHWGGLRLAFQLA